MARRRRAVAPVAGEGDHVERLRAAWARELPTVETLGMAIVGRARRITLALRPEIEAVFGRHGLDAGEFDVLATLRRAGEPYRLRPTALYSALMVSSAGMADRLARLAAAGLVRRERDPDDGRSLLVELTPRGRDVVEAAFQEDMAVEQRVVELLSPEEAGQLAALLAKLARAIERREP